jgi:RimJ/RimL family protein N-acetyltransferase
VAPDVVHTDRLVGRRVALADLGDLCRLHADPRVMATMGGLLDADETAARLRRQIAHWERHGFGQWIFRDGGGGFVGRGGLAAQLLDGVEEVEVAYALAAEAWGRGLATEIARASVRVGLEVLGRASLIAFTLPTNRGSRRVMEKCGFLYERDIVHAGLPHVLYRIRNSV